MLSKKEGKLENDSKVTCRHNRLAAPRQHPLLRKLNIASPGKRKIFTGSGSQRRAKKSRFEDEALNEKIKRKH